MFAMKDMLRWLAAGCLALSLAAPAFAQNQQFQDRANKAPMNGRTYVTEQVENMKRAYKAAMLCRGDNGGVDEWNVWDPDRVAACMPAVQRYRDSLIDIDGGPPLVFGNRAEEEQIRREAAIINAMVPTIAEVVGTQSSVKSAHPELYKDIQYFRSLTKWEKQEAGKYIEEFKALDQLFARYWQAKKKGRLDESTKTFTCSDSVMKEMNDVRQELAQYFAYNVDNYNFTPLGKGLFLESLDRYRNNFLKKVDSCIEHQKASAERLKKLKERLLDCWDQASQIGKNSLFFDLAKVPDSLLVPNIGLFAFLERDNDYMIKKWEGWKNGEDTIGYIFSQKLVKDTGFHGESGADYRRTVRIECFINLLNAVDKDGKPIKHNIRGLL